MYYNDDFLIAILRKGLFKGKYGKEITITYYENQFTFLVL